MSEDRQGTYVYGVTRAGTTLDALEDAKTEVPEVSLLEVGDLAAIVSDAPADDEGATRDAVLAHAQVLAAAVKNAAVVPMRFGIVFPNDEAVQKELLEERRDELTELLDKFDSVVEMLLKVYYREDAILRQLVEGDPEIARLREAIRQGPEEATYNERVRLGELVNAAIERRREEDASELMDRLKPLVADSAIEEVEKEFMVLNAPFLVERDRLEEFEGTLESVAEDRLKLMSFKLLGPMPAYHFIDLEEAAWA